MDFKAFIVDDDDIFNMLSVKLMQRSSFHEEPLSFEGAEAALLYFKEVYNPDEVFILFLDINMPGMDGWEFLEELGAIADPSNTHVVMVTSSNDDEDVARAKENSFVVDYLTKPVITDDLNTLKKLPKLSHLFEA